MFLIQLATQLHLARNAQLALFYLMESAFHARPEACANNVTYKIQLYAFLVCQATT